MLDWNTRLDQLHLFLRSAYQIDDPQARPSSPPPLSTAPGTPALWLVLETNWFSRNCHSAWFGFGQTWQPAARIFKVPNSPSCGSGTNRKSCRRR
jgi:hypothetical protein